MPLSPNLIQKKTFQLPSPPEVEDHIVLAPRQCHKDLSASGWQICPDKDLHITAVGLNTASSRKPVRVVATRNIDQHQHPTATQASDGLAKFLY